ncbi:MAG: response regulator, partial [Anaerolineae bacterium]|nr:response regulator [Anaerolineae bacterium]
AFKRMLDLDDASAMKCDWVDAIHPDDRPRMIEHQRRMLRGIDHQFELEFRYFDRSGGIRVIRSRVVRAGSDDTDFTFIGMGEDMTLKRQVQADNERILKQALTSQKAEALGQLAGGIAHDFKNLLSVVEGYGSLALQHRATQDAPELRGFVDAIVAAGRRGRDLIAKLLAFSQPSPSTRPTATAIEPVVGEVVALLQAVIPASIRLELAIVTAVPPILIAPIELHQVLVNLVVNARDAMRGSGEIRISVGEPMPIGAVCSSCHTAVPDLPVQVRVKDNGHGMNEGTLTRAFEPFFTTKDFAQGTGMGLAVVNGLVHQAGGHIVVESEDGAGCVFRLFFAAAEGVMGTPAASETVGLSGVDLVGLRVLVVEDDDALRCFLREVLEAEQITVTVAMNGPAALALALTAPIDYDVLITDHTMPEMTGIELIQSLRANGIIWPAVLFSGHSDSIRDALRDPDVVFVGKPASPPDIIAAVGHAAGLMMI